MRCLLTIEEAGEIAAHFAYWMLYASYSAAVYSNSLVIVAAKVS